MGLHCDGRRDEPMDITTEEERLENIDISKSLWDNRDSTSLAYLIFEIQGSKHWPYSNHPTKHFNWDLIKNPACSFC